MTMILKDVDWRTGISSSTSVLWVELMMVHMIHVDFKRILNDYLLSKSGFQSNCTLGVMFISWYFRLELKGVEMQRQDDMEMEGMQEIDLVNETSTWSQFNFSSFLSFMFVSTVLFSIINEVLTLKTYLYPLSLQTCCCCCLDSSFQFHLSSQK